MHSRRSIALGQRARENIRTSSRLQQRLAWILCTRVHVYVRKKFNKYYILSARIFQIASKPGGGKYRPARRKCTRRNPHEVKHFFVVKNLKHSLSSQLESYFNVLLNANSLRPVVKLNRSVRKMTVSALVNSALVPLYRAGNCPGLPFSDQMAVELSNGSYGHLAVPVPTPGTYSCLGKCVRLDCVRKKKNIK